MTDFEPAYIKTKQQGLLRERINRSRKILQSCTLCPRECRVNRLEGETGICRTGEDAVVASFNAHFGEEPPLVGVFGSGTIFFTHCSLMCNFCQNYDISHEGVGESASIGQLAGTMLILQNSGCHNINLVTPTHVIPQILSALDMAIDGGLHIPLVYNTNAYDKVSSLQLLDGIVDIYMPDFKFWDSRIAEQTCQAPDYPEVAREALAEMQRQVGDLSFNASGIAERGLLIRHLVFPSGLAGTRHIMEFIVNRISPNAFVNIMDQYRPCGEAANTEDLSRPITDAEYRQAVAEAKAAGITRFAV